MKGKLARGKTTISVTISDPFYNTASRDTSDIYKLNKKIAEEGQKPNLGPTRTAIYSRITHAFQEQINLTPSLGQIRMRSGKGKR